jgi:hypothetical protein
MADVLAVPGSDSAWFAVRVERFPAVEPETFWSAVAFTISVALSIWIVPFNFGTRRNPKEKSGDR